MTPPSRPPFHYHGGKWMLAKKIIELFPPHISYVEPFGGAGSVLLRKPPSVVETYNDLDKAIVGFFKVLRERPDELIRAISLTPYSRAELKLSYEPSGDELEQARRLYVRMTQGRSKGSSDQKTGWRYLTTNGPGTVLTHSFASVAHLPEIVERLKVVQIECDSAVTVIKRYDTPRTLFYVDPPYVLSSRSSGKAYSHEMDDNQHRELAEVLHSVQGMVILSGYQSDLYAELYRDWQAKVFALHADNTSGTREEYVWLSPNTQRAHQADSVYSLPLFQQVASD